MVTMTPEMEALLNSIQIKHGSTPEKDAQTEKRMCVMEATAYIAGEDFSDAPVCVSPVITSFLIGINDSRERRGSVEELEKLKQVIPEILHTRPTQQKVVKEWVDGVQRDVSVTVSDSNPAYRAAEQERWKLVLKEADRLNLFYADFDREYYGDEVILEGVDFVKLSTETGIEIVRKLAKLGT